MLCFTLTRSRSQIICLKNDGLTFIKYSSLFFIVCFAGGFGKATRSCLLDEENMVAVWDDVVVQECGEEREVDLGDLPEVGNRIAVLPGVHCFY